MWWLSLLRRHLAAAINDDTLSSDVRCTSRHLGELLLYFPRRLHLAGASAGLADKCASHSSWNAASSDFIFSLSVGSLGLASPEMTTLRLLLVMSWTVLCISANKDMLSWFWFGTAVAVVMEFAAATADTVVGFVSAFTLLLIIFSSSTWSTTFWMHSLASASCSFNFAIVTWKVRMYDCIPTGWRTIDFMWNVSS